MISREIFPKAPGSVAIIPSQSTAYPSQMLTLTATGCNGGEVHWTYTEGSTTMNLQGKSVEVVGPNTYYARCITYGTTGPQASITIPQATGIPKIITDKARVRPNETFTFQVDFSNCPSYGWPGGSTLVTQDGVTTTLWGWDPITLTGPAVLEARCENASWAKQTKEVFFAPGDNLRLVANKSKAKHDESVTLTTYGCEFGFIEWKIGTNVILGHQLDPKRQITQVGPGYYKARCKNDLALNSEWVTAYVDLDGSIVPVISGPSTLCPNTAATITTTGCPSGYYNSWNTLENSGFIYGGNSVSIYLPQTVKLKCTKNDESWTSDPKDLIVASAIPDNIKITGTTSVVSGTTAMLSGTSIVGATYLWTPPAGVTIPVLNNRVLQIPSVSTAHAGEYKLKISSGGCEVEVSARLDVGLCDNLYIKAYDPTSGEEKMKLNRKPGQLNLYDDLALEVQTFEGEVLKGVEYTWTAPQGVAISQDPINNHKVTINKVGNYKVNVTSTGGVACPLEIDISALVCATPTDFLTCGSTSTVTSSGTEKLKNLAVGDVFSTYDYLVTVMEVSGTESTGWTGRGFIELSFLKLTTSALAIPLAVRFDNIHLNQCYQLMTGSKVVTEFDESWGNVVVIQDIITPLDNTFQELTEFLKIYKDTPEDRAKLQNYITALDEQKNSIQNSSELNPTFKQEIIQHIDQTSTNLTCLASPSPNAKTLACNYADVLDQIEEANMAIAPLVYFAIKAGGQCLTAAVLDIATQYTLEGSLMWLNGEINSFAEFNKIWPKVNYLQAGATCIESIFGCTPCSASINGVASITQSILAEYNIHKENVDKYNWSGIGVNLFVDVAASYIGNVAGQELAEYFAKFKSKIAQQGYHQVRSSLKKFLPDQLADMLMHKASGLLNSAGKFADTALELNYAKYIQKKQKQGGAAKDRLTWLEAVEYFQEKTNIPRGNAFNQSRKAAYPINEITLENGKRLDSYIPGQEIVSRKATDLIDIEESTFKAYLAEMKSKYGPPKMINNTTYKKYETVLINRQLSGILILEIPNSNSSFIELDRYKNVAKSYGITIRLAPE